MDAKVADGEPMELPVSTHAQLAAHALVNIPESHEMDQYLEALERTRVEHECNGNYEDADAHRERAEFLRDHEDNRRRQQLENQHRTEVLNINEAHMKELMDFEKSWDEKHDEFEQHGQSLLDTLAGRHQTELEATTRKLERTVQPISPKWSRDLLNLRKIQESLAKQKKYKEATEAQKEAAEMEERELQHWEATRNEKIRKLVAQQEKKNSMEMEGLRKRIASGREEQRQAMAAEKNRLIQRYLNTKRQHANQHKLVSHRAERYGSLAQGGTGAAGIINSQILLGPRPSSGRGKPASPGVQTYADASHSSGLEHGNEY